MNNSPKLFVCIGNSEISIIAGLIDERNNFEFLEKSFLPIGDISENKISFLNKSANSIKKNILLIEQKINYTFKNIIIILDNFDTSFLNLCGFKKLNGTQVSKENITYILNNLKSYVEKFEEKKKITHIFNSRYFLDKKETDNLPIGLFGEFYSHEISFNLINNNDFRNLKNIFDNCNLKIEKILLDSFVKGSIISNTYQNSSTFFYIEINDVNSKIFYFENDALKFEQKFNFGSDLILKDISKIISLDFKVVKDIIYQNPNIHQIEETEILEENYFKNQGYRKIKKKLILQIAEARIKEIINLFFHKNINFKNKKKNIKKIFLLISEKESFECFGEIYRNSFNNENKYELNIMHKLDIQIALETALKIVLFGWKKEAIPVTSSKNTLFMRFFRSLFK